MFQTPIEMEFEGKLFYAPTLVKEYLKLRYGNYMELPSKEQQRSVVHAMTFNTFVDYKKYFNKNEKLLK